MIRWGLKALYESRNRLVPVPARLPTYFLVLVLGVSVWLGSPGGAYAADPIKKTGLLEALKIGGLEHTELVAIIRERGVAFSLTPAVEDELKAAGASELVLAAVREVQPIEVEDGPPLGKDQLLLLLDSGAPARRISAMIGKRGINFPFTAEAERELRRHGADSAMLTLLDSVASNEASAAPTPTAGHKTSPKLVRKFQPAYSEEARARGIEGTVKLSIEVHPDGKPRNVKVVSGLGYGLDEQAVRAVETWRFKPGTQNGVPAMVAAVVEINFRLPVEPQGVIVVAVRTERYLNQAGAGDGLQGKLTDLVGFLTAQGVHTLEESGRIASGGPPSFASLRRQATDIGGDSILYIVVDRPMTKSAELHAYCYDLSGNIGWEEKSWSRWGWTAKGSVSKSIDKLKRRLRDRVGGPCLRPKRGPL